MNEQEIEKALTEWCNYFTSIPSAIAELYINGDYKAYESAITTMNYYVKESHKMEIVSEDEFSKRCSILAYLMANDFLVIQKQ